MADTLPPGTPEVDDPLLVADLIALLSIKGAIGRLPLADIVIPTVSLGDVVTPSIEILQPTFRSTDVFSAGLQTAPGANTVMADTGAQVAGNYDVIVTWVGKEATNNMNWSLQHRDAANTGTLMETIILAFTTVNIPWNESLTFGYTLGINERLRVITNAAAAASQLAAATIFARLRT